MNEKEFAGYLIEEVLKIYISEADKTKKAIEHKLNDLRKVLERFFKHLTGENENAVITLNDLMMNYFSKAEHPEFVRETSFILKKELNNWAHDNNKSPREHDLHKAFYFAIDVIRFISGVEIDKQKYAAVFSPKTLVESENKKQHICLESTKRMVFVNAGPGTGKTHLILKKIERLLTQIDITEGSSKIIALSFTNLASDELKYRVFEEITGTELIDKAGSLHFGTIHSFCLERMIQYGKKSSDDNYNYSVMDEDDERDYKSILTEVQFKAFLKDNRLLTFGEILRVFKRQFSEDKGFQKFISECIKVILIDEAQDLSQIQYEIFYEILKFTPSVNLFIVGDQRQNIFDFNGGTLNHLDLIKDEFKEDFCSFDLEVCYRCPQSILEKVNNFVFPGMKNTPLVIDKIKPSDDVEILEFQDKVLEAQAISEIVLKSGDLNNIVILYPNTFYFENIAAEFNKLNIPFRIFGGRKHLPRYLKLVKDLIILIADLDRTLSWIRFLRYFDPGLKNLSLTEGESLKEVLVMHCKASYNPEVSSLMVKIIESLFVVDKPDLFGKFIYIKLAKLMHIFDVDKIMGEKELEEMWKLIKLLLNENNMSEPHKITFRMSANHPEFKDFYRSEINLSCAAPENLDYITISTIHSAKGKEWDLVIIPGMTGNLFPGYKSDFNSELKKFYVACTRAQKKLIMTWPKSYEVRTATGKNYFFENQHRSPLLKYFE